MSPKTFFSRPSTEGSFLHSHFLKNKINPSIKERKMNKILFYSVMASILLALTFTFSCSSSDDGGGGGGGEDPSSSSPVQSVTVFCVLGTSCLPLDIENCLQYGTPVDSCPAEGESSSSAGTSEGESSSSSPSGGSSSSGLSSSSSAGPPKECTDLFNPENKFCYDGVVYDKCDGIEYPPATHICKDGVASPAKCGDVAYNPLNQICQSNVVKKTYGSMTDDAGQTYKTI